MMRLTMFAMLVVFATPAAAGPFGVSMGQSVAALGGKRSATDNSYKVVVPKPHPEFESYTVIATPQTGICKIWGIGRDHRNDRSGSDVRIAYGTLKSILENKYGPSREFDFLHSGALWDKSSEWVMAVSKKERTLAAFWSAENGSRLSDDLVSITLEVEAYESDTAYLDLTYEFSNFTRCRAQIQAKQSDSL